MKRKIIRVLNGVIVLAILSGVFWVFRGNISQFFEEHLSKSVPSGVEKQTTIGVPRRISYLGRIREAKKLMEHEYHSLATIEISAAIAEKPQLSQPYFLLGEVYLRSEQPEKLENLIAQIELKFPNHPETDVLRARKLITEKDFVSALAILETRQETINSGLKFYHAILLALQNDHLRARDILNALKKLPIEESSLTVSESGVDEVIAAAETIPPELEKKVTDVLSVYDEFDEFADGKNPHLFALIAKKLAENEESALAHAFAELAIKEDIEYIDAWILRGYSLFLMQDYKKALGDFQHAYEMDPLRPETQYFLALTLDKTGRDEEAAMFFEKALEHNFEFSSEVRWKLIEIFAAQQKFDRVLELYQQLVAENPEPKKFVDAVHTSIDILQRPEIALEITKKLLAENQSDVLAMNLNAWALIANKQFFDAEKILKAAQKLDPTRPRTFLNLGLLAEKQEQFSNAAELYKKAYELGKNKPFDSVVNLAAEKYNELILRDENPAQPEATKIPANSP
ncbi:tetratricopeptide repeat protein [bacterium]|jgi:tetratricopeptide (TPR) repeat protein|nr:tetratricopeptide repeat protein [bacterium]MBT6831449.1 tetratricopeptide repeat protein [bacterium]MBT6996355.1 tetratricopeptide repeat protein [bacterium]MBT7772422.1 tetratricopeptide repeat protein [bacterium]